MVDVASIVQACILAGLVLSLTAILSLVQVLKWVLVGKGLLERREDVAPSAPGEVERPLPKPYHVGGC